MEKVFKGNFNTIILRVYDKFMQTEANLKNLTAEWRIVSSLDTRGEDTVYQTGVGVIDPLITSQITLLLGDLQSVPIGVSKLEVRVRGIAKAEYLYDPLTILLRVEESIADTVMYPVSVDFSIEGTTGLSGTVTGGLDRDKYFLPTDSEGRVIDFSECYTTLTIFVDGVDDTESWEITQERSEGVTVSEEITSRTATITGLSKNSGSVRFTARKSGYSSFFADFFVEKLVGAFNLQTTVESTNGDQFRPGQAKTTLLIAHVFAGGVEVTNQIPSEKFSWTRVSYYPSPGSDEAWNALYASGYKQIELTVDNINLVATYHCSILQ